MSHNTNDPLPSWEELARHLLAINHEYKKIVRSSGKLNEKQDSLTLWLEDIHDQIQELTNIVMRMVQATRGSSPPLPARRPRPPWKRNEARLRDQAAPGIAHYELEWLDKRRARVRLDHHKLVISRGLVEVLDRLATAERQWWPTGELAKGLTITVHNLQGRISRLRGEFYSQGCNPLYVVTAGKGENARVRLLRQTAGAGAAPADVLRSTLIGDLKRRRLMGLACKANVIARFLRNVIDPERR